jgi:twitching motility protein PilU
VGEVIERLVAFFPEAERKGYLQVLSGQLLAVLCQKLVPSCDDGVVLACEYLSNIGLTRECILHADLPGLRDHLAQADSSESMDFLHAFQRLAAEGRVSEETALLSVSNPAELRRRLRGISSNLS